jgi:hypothetical protein
VGDPDLGLADGASHAERARYLLCGEVLAVDGSPLADVVVASSAGGRALSDGGGSFRLEVEIPPGVDVLQLRALSVEAGLSASATLTLPPSTSRAFRVVAVDPLRLSGPLTCEPSWLPTFGGEPGVSNPIDAFAVFDDGRGPALYAGGSFLAAGGVPVNHVARWDGTRWSALADGVSHSVAALVVHDDGRGLALFVAGQFTSASGMPANRIARWDGTRWSTVGSPFGFGVAINALAVHDDGRGPALYAGGTHGHVSRWDGATWSELTDGPDDTVLALASFDDGSGPALYAGGFFLTVNGLSIPGVARWDGGGWSAVGNGRSGIVTSLLVHDDGSGSALYAGGAFNGRIARWRGTSWSTVGTGLNSTVNALAVHDGGGGPELYAGGDFTRSGPTSARRVARWNGTSWSSLGNGADLELQALASYDDGRGSRLYAGGVFLTMDGAPANRFASWDGTRWSAYGDGPSGFVLALLEHDDGSGPALFAGGFLRAAGGVTLNGVGRWDGAAWSALEAGLDGRVEDLAEHDDGSGPALFAGGVFSNAGGRSANSIAKWDGLHWSPLGSGMGEPSNLALVQALASHDDGSGPRLYAGGNFGAAGGVPALNVARWDGSTWAPLAGGGTSSTVYDFATFDDGSGPALYVGGAFAFAGSVRANNLARWDGSGWSALGAGLSSTVFALAVHDDGSGPALYAGGTFQRADGMQVNHLARWDGAAWSAVGPGFATDVRALVAHDDGDGPGLYVGGGSLLGTSAPARWDGADFRPLGGGMNGLVETLASIEVGSDRALYAGGWFSTTFPSQDSYLARWAREETRLDFSTEDDFATPLVNGQDLSSPPELGRLVSLTSLGPNAGAAIFDSTPGGPNDPSQDIDLLVGRGNLLILQTDANTTQTVPGIFDRPNDDSDGGVLVLDFRVPVRATSVDLVDIDSGAREASAVVLRDDAGRLRTYSVPRGWTGDRLVDGTSGVRTLDLTTLAPQPGFQAEAPAGETPGFAPERVVRIEMRLGGSGAVDDLRWCQPRVGADVGGPREAQNAPPSRSEGPIVR